MLLCFKNAAPSSNMLVGNPAPPCNVLSRDPQLRHIERDIGGWHVSAITLLLMGMQPDIGHLVLL